MRNQQTEEGYELAARTGNTVPAANSGMRLHGPAADTRQPLHSPAVLGTNVTVKGEIYSDQDLIIEGLFEGTIDVPGHRLTVGPDGKVAVDVVNATEIVVFGSLKGNLNVVDRVIIRKDAEVVGDIQTSGIVIDDGAYFKGGISIRQASPKAVDEAPRS